MRLCSGPCKSDKPLESFSRDSSTNDGLRYDCNECRASKRHAHNLKDLSKASHSRRKHRLMTTYGITPEQYDQMYAEQFGQCKICDKHQQEFAKRLFVDHDHKTGKVRGLLCFNCNIAIGKLQDDAQLCIKAAAYLKGV